MKAIQRRDNGRVEFFPLADGTFNHPLDDHNDFAFMAWSICGSIHYWDKDALCGPEPTP